MHKRPTVSAIVGLLLGILAASTNHILIWLSAIGLAILMLKQVQKDGRKVFAAFRFCLFTVSFCIGAGRYESEQAFRSAYEDRLTDGAEIIVQGTVNEKEYKNNQYLYYLKNCYLVLSNDLIPCNQIIAKAESDMAAIGEILVVKGQTDAFSQARNEGNFDELSFYQSQKIDLRIYEIEIMERHGERNEFREALFLLRQKLCRVYEDCMTEDTGGVLAMMVLGEKSLLNAEVKELYQKVGISHILAISGLHISVIGMSLYRMLRKIGTSYLVSGCISGTFMVIYGMMTGFRPSSARAICMFLMMLIAGVIGRTYDSLSALSFSAFCLLCENPYLLEYAGFLFSFAAVLGVVVVGNTIVKTLESEKGKELVLKGVYTSFSIQLMTLPLTAYFYYEIPMYGIFVNLLILPLVGALLACGIIGGVAGLASYGLAKWILLPCQWILIIYQQLSSVVQRLPYAAFITGKPDDERMVIYYIVLFLIVAWIAWRGKQRFFGLIGCLLLMFVLTLPEEGFELNVVDVGQGDGSYIRTASGHHLFIDGGSSDVYQVGKYRILPFLKANGVRKIDYWFVSHADKDHVSGLKELLETGYSIDNLVISKRSISDSDYEELLVCANENGTHVTELGYLDEIHFGEAVVTCIFPYDDYVIEDKNALSMVLLYEEDDFSGLFTGDIGTGEEQRIMESIADLKLTGKVSFETLDFYKVAHHGSRYSNSEALLKYLKPDVAVISSGPNNRYGHPHAETLERLAAAGCEVWNTAECGQVKLKYEKGIMELNVFRK